LRGDAELCTGELVTNAVKAYPAGKGAGCVLVTIVVSSRFVCVVVRDSAPGVPVERRAPGATEHPDDAQGV
jgi:anti-sigma regulatory factor (Ser/Thr protein kinase)